MVSTLLVLCGKPHNEYYIGLTYFDNPCSNAPRWDVVVKPQRRALRLGDRCVLRKSTIPDVVYFNVDESFVVYI